MKMNITLLNYYICDITIITIYTSYNYDTMLYSYYYMVYND